MKDRLLDLLDADTVKVWTATIAAVGVSFADIEAVLRIVALVVTIAYTVKKYLESKKEDK